MPLLFGKTTRAIATLCLGLFLVWASAYAQQRQGRIIDRNGAPQAGCQIDFSAAAGQPPIYRATSNRDGSFYLNNARPGTYYVVVRSGQKAFTVNVTVEANGLNPSTLVATW